MCVCVCVVFPQPPVVVRFPSFVVESDLWPKMRGKKGVVEEPESESTSSEEEVVDLTEAMKTEFSAFSGASTEPGTTARKPKGKKKKKDKKDKKNVFSLSTFQAEAPKKKSSLWADASDGDEDFYSSLPTFEYVSTEEHEKLAAEQDWSRSGARPSRRDPEDEEPSKADLDADWRRGGPGPVAGDAGGSKGGEELDWDELRHRGGPLPVSQDSGPSFGSALPENSKLAPFLPLPERAPFAVYVDRLPDNCSLEDLDFFFKDCALDDVKYYGRSAYVEFSTQADLRRGLLKDGEFIRTSRLKMEVFNPARPRNLRESKPAPADPSGAPLRGELVKSMSEDITSSTEGPVRGTMVISSASLDSDSGPVRGTMVISSTPPASDSGPERGTKMAELAALKEASASAASEGLVAPERGTMVTTRAPAPPHAEKVEPEGPVRGTMVISRPSPAEKVEAESSSPQEGGDANQAPRPRLARRDNGNQDRHGKGADDRGPRRSQSGADEGKGKGGGQGAEEEGQQGEGGDGRPSGHRKGRPGRRDTNRVGRFGSAEDVARDAERFGGLRSSDREPVVPHPPRGVGGPRGRGDRSGRGGHRGERKGRGLRGAVDADALADSPDTLSSDTAESRFPIRGDLMRSTEKAPAAPTEDAAAAAAAAVDGAPSPLDATSPQSGAEGKSGNGAVGGAPYRRGGRGGGGGGRGRGGGRGGSGGQRNAPSRYEKPKLTTDTGGWTVLEKGQAAQGRASAPSRNQRAAADSSQSGTVSVAQLAKESPPANIFEGFLDKGVDSD